MRVTGIICEYNPLHSGHAYQLRVARESGADCIVLVMSGSFTERGDVAILDKYSRAEEALLSGADVVLELPYPYSAGSAEYFARAGVRILEDLSVGTLCFGSETGDGEFLRRAAEVAASDSFREAYALEGEKGTGSAAAYFSLLSAHMGVKEFGSNDVLGVEYVKAILLENARIEPFVIRREGAAYHADAVTAGQHPSATALRRAILSAESREEMIRAYETLSGLSDAAVEPFRAAIRRGSAPAQYKEGFGAMLGFYRMQTPSGLSGIAEMHGGLAERICRAASDAVTVEEFLRLAATKKYTDSRVRRAILYGMTGVREEDLSRFPAFVNLLGASPRGREFLSEIRKRKERRVEIVTRPAAVLDDSKSPDFRRQAELQLRAEALYTLFLPEKEQAGVYLRSRAVMM